MLQADKENNFVQSAAPLAALFKLLTTTLRVLGAAVLPAVDVGGLVPLGVATFYAYQQQLTSEAAGLLEGLVVMSAHGQDGGLLAPLVQQAIPSILRASVRMSSADQVVGLGERAKRLSCGLRYCYDATFALVCGF